MLLQQIYSHWIGDSFVELQKNLSIMHLEILNHAARSLITSFKKRWLLVIIFITFSTTRSLNRVSNFLLFAHLSCAEVL